MYATLEKAAHAVAKTMAVIGGLILLVLTIVTCFSIAGRALVPLDIGIGPIRGIYDITEISIAASVFAFLPWVQLQEGHARVDLFKWALPPKLDKALDLLFQLMMTALAFVIAWRLYLGMQDKIAYSETTLIAQIPVWQGYALSLIGAVGFVLISAFCVIRATRRLMGLEAVT